MKQISKSLFSIAAVMSMGVSAASPWPTGTIDEATTTAGQSIDINVLNNDTGESLFIKSVNESSVGWGQIAINNDNLSLSYTPYSGYTGKDEFWYVLEDAEGRTNAAKVIVNVTELTTPAGTWPQGVNDYTESDFGSIIKLPVLSNDIGTDLKLVSVNDWSVNQGKAWISGDNEISYQQFGDEREGEQDEFWYVFSDQLGRTNAAKVTLSLTVQSETSWSTATPDFAEAKDGLRVTIPVLANDKGLGLTLESANAWTQQGGRTKLIGDTVRYTPPADFEGVDGFWYDFIDAAGRKNSAKVEVTVSQNKQTSVVNFCGENYATLGTKKTTQKTDLAPQALAEQFSGNLTDGLIIGERRYYLQDPSSSFVHVLMMEFNGESVPVYNLNTPIRISALGVADGKLYFNGNSDIFAHDGFRLISYGDLGERQGLDTNAGSVIPRLVSTELRQNGQNFLYSTSVLSTNEEPIRRFWRLGGSAPVVIGDERNDFPGSFQSLGDFSTGNFQHFNGLDYYVHSYVGGSRLQQNDNGANLNRWQNDLGNGDVESMTVDGNRLLIVTKASEVDSAVNEPSKLLTIDNVTNEFVELASCE